MIDDHSAALPLIGLLFANYLVHRNPTLIAMAWVFRALVAVDLGVAAVMVLAPHLPSPFDLAAARALVVLLLLMHVATAFQARVAAASAASAERAANELEALRRRIAEEEGEETAEAVVEPPGR